MRAELSQSLPRGAFGGGVFGLKMSFSVVTDDAPGGA
jgi:hypothetical protein